MSTKDGKTSGNPSFTLRLPPSWRKAIKRIGKREGMKDAKVIKNLLRAPLIAEGAKDE